MSGLRYASTGQDHGYSLYTAGCRCDICKAAKRAYMAGRRQEARSAPADRSAEDFKHGTRFGYEERGCRCGPCTVTYLSDRLRDTRQRPGREAYRCRTCGYRYGLCCCPRIGSRAVTP